MTSDRWFVNSYILQVQPELGFPHSWCLYSVMNWDQKLNNRVNIEVLHGEQIWIQLMTCETWFGEDHEYKALLAWLRIVLPCHGIRPTGQWSYGLQLHRQVSVIWKVFVHVSLAYYKGAILGFNADWLWWTTSHTFCFLILIKMCVYKRHAVPGSPGRFRWFKKALFPGRLEGSGGLKRPCCKLACGYVHLDLALNLWKSETRPGLTKSWQCFTVTHNRCKFISTAYQLIFYLVFDIVYTLFWLLNLALWDKYSLKIWPLHPLYFMHSCFWSYWPVLESVSICNGFTYISQVVWYTKYITLQKHLDCYMSVIRLSVPLLCLWVTLPLQSNHRNFSELQRVISQCR